MEREEELDKHDEKSLAIIRNHSQFWITRLMQIFLSLIPPPPAVPLRAELHGKWKPFLHCVHTVHNTTLYLHTKQRQTILMFYPSSEVASARLPSATGHWAPAVSPDRLAAVLKTLQTQIHGLFLFHKLFIERLDEEMKTPASLPWWGWCEAVAHLHSAAC